MKFFDKDPVVEFIIELLKQDPIMIDTFEELELMERDDEFDNILDDWK